MLSSSSPPVSRVGLLDQEAHSLTSEHSDHLPPTSSKSSLPYPASSSKSRRHRHTCSWCNYLCSCACICCRSIPSIRPLFTSFEYIPLARKIWYILLCASQLAAIHYHQYRFGQLIVGCFGVIFIFSLLWAIKCSGWHRGIGFPQLVIFIPLLSYLILLRLGFDESAFNRLAGTDRILFYAMDIEIGVLGLSCLWSFYDVLRWLRGKRRVWGHEVIFPRTHAHGEYDPSGAGGGSGLGSDMGSGHVSDDDMHDEHHPDDIDLDHRTSSPYPIPSYSILSDGEHSFMSRSFEWTPNTRSEHLLNRAAEAMREQQEQQNRQQQQARERDPNL